MRRVIEAEFMLQGTEMNIDSIVKEITEISTHKEVKDFNLKDLNLTVRIY